MSESDEMYELLKTYYLFGPQEDRHEIVERLWDLGISTNMVDQLIIDVLRGVARIASEAQR